MPSSSLFAPTWSLTRPPTRKCVRVCVFLHLPVCFWSSECASQACSSPYPVCHLNSFSSTGAPVRLGPECCTSWMCLLHLVWMRTAVPWHPLLFPVDAQVRPSFVLDISSFCILQDSSKVTTSQCSYLSSLNSTVSSSSLSSLVKECVLLDHRECDRVVVVVLVNSLWFCDFVLVI